VNTAERFEAKYEPEPNSGCFIWIGARSKDGYGFITINNKMDRSHRVAWRLAGYVLLPGYQVLHKCDNRACVRVEHMFVGTNQDNVDDRMAKGGYLRGPRHPNARKTHCPHGHPYEGANLRINSSGGRICIICRDAYNKAYKHARLSS
jgi:HNH endonuclease